MNPAQGQSSEAPREAALHLDPGVAEAIVNGDYQDIFGMLGQHGGPAGGQVLRVFLPGALGVALLSPAGEPLGSLQRVHEAGLFCGWLDSERRLPYRLRVDYAEGSVLRDDPYRFASLLDAEDVYLFNDGTQEQAWRFLGANPRQCEGVDGFHFAVWAPNARRVSVVGDFNHWDGRVHVMRRHHPSGLWDIFLPGLAAGSAYKFEIIDARGRPLPLKADPYAKRMQLRPNTASLLQGPSEFRWEDDDWMHERGRRDSLAAPLSIYEVHLGSWRRHPERGDAFLSYRELADELVSYASWMGFTHLQLLPISEFPFDGSWGYQPLGLFAPTSRFGTPDDFRYFVNACHRARLGVLLDWVPGHFPADAHGLGQFDGSHLYEHADPRLGYHPDWNTLIYNYGRAEVRSYLISNALYWLREFHIDGLRFDAVASMLYLDYSRNEGEWIPNWRGGRENLEAIELLRQVNARAYFNVPGVMMIAEESTAWPGVTDFVDRGGLGFGFKWNLGWMHDTLSYLARDPIHRKFHHSEMTFGLLYAWSEKYILPLSHDEVVHGKRSLLGRVPGDDWQKFATLRAYYAFMWTHPGKKLLFMGGEFAQREEWSYDRSLDWHLMDLAPHQGVQRLVRDLNHLYREQPALHEYDHNAAGFEWLDADNHGNSVYIYLRRGREAALPLLVALNMTPSVHLDFRVGVPCPGFYRELLNSDAVDYGGSGMGNEGGVEAEDLPWQGRPWSLRLRLPPLACVILGRI